MDVVQYVSNQPDECVKEMFLRFVEVKSDLTAIFDEEVLCAYSCAT